MNKLFCFKLHWTKIRDWGRQQREHVLFRSAATRHVIRQMQSASAMNRTHLVESVTCAWYRYVMSQPALRVSVKCVRLVAEILGFYSRSGHSQNFKNSFSSFRARRSAQAEVRRVLCMCCSSCMSLNSVQSFVIENCNRPSIENGLNNVCLHPLPRTFPLCHVANLNTIKIIKVAATDHCLKIHQPSWIKQKLFHFEVKLSKFFLFYKYNTNVTNIETNWFMSE